MMHSKFLSLVAFSIIIFILPQSAISQNLTMNIQGECMDYNVTVFLEGFGTGCYDVKIDATTPAGRVGEIYDPREGWKSSFYYVNEGLCIQEDPSQSNLTHNKTFLLRILSSSPQVSFKGTVRHGSVTWGTGYQDVVQDCPPSSPMIMTDQQFFLSVLTVILVILAGLVIYKRIMNREETVKKKGK